MIARELIRLGTFKLPMYPMDVVPKDGTYVILFGPSGYVGTPHRAAVCRWDPKFRPRQPWVDYAGDSFLDGGEAPIGWWPLPSGMYGE